MFIIDKFTVEYCNKPIGISKTPRFSWVLSSDKRNVKQTLYTLEIALDKDFKDIVFGIEENTEKSIHNKYDELKLKSYTEYYVRVRVKNNYDEETEYAYQSFVTALLSPDELVAKFVTVEKETDADNSKGTYIRKEFLVKKPVKKAYAVSTALGLYHLYINGEKVGNDELTPGWTSYNKHLLYQMYDVTDFINENEKQCFGAMLGAGFYKGVMGFFLVRNNYGKRTAFFCQIYIEYEDGTSEIICTDEECIGTDSPVVFSEIYDGEIYDAGLEIDGWCETCKKDTRINGETVEWSGVDIVDFDKTVMVSQFGCKPVIREKFPCKIIITPEGDKVLDFSQNMAGFIHMKVIGAKAGDIVELDCFETLDANGNVYLENLRSAKNRFIYTCKGTETEEYHPYFTFQGFRYAKVVSYPGELNSENFTACAVYSDMEVTGKFISSDENVNKLFNNIGWGLRSNFVDVPTDCPQRDERCGWTGDAQIFCRTGLFIMNSFLFYEKWLVDVAMDQTEEGGVPHIVPDLATNSPKLSENWLLSQGTHSAAAWADVAVLNPWNMYLTFGDKQILLDHYSSMKKWIDFMESHADGIVWNYKLQFGDWVALDAQEGSYYGATPNDLTCTAYYAYSTGIFAKIAKIVGNEEDYKYYSSLEEKIKDGFADLFFDKTTGGMTVQTQTAHIIALYFNLTKDEYKEGTVRELLELLNKEGGHLVTGFIGTPYFTHALSQNGHLEDAYNLFMKDDFPSWLYQVKKGATTVWEHWDGLKPDGTMWSADMNSFNHYAYGSIGEWMVRVIAGIEIDENNPGYKHAIIYPRPGGGLKYAQGEYESQYGPLKVRWEYDDAFCKKRIKVDVKVPVNTSASFRLDDIEKVITSDGIENSDITILDNVLMCELPSGNYSFTCDIAK